MGPGTGATAPEVHDPVPRAFPWRLHQFEKKGIGQTGEQEQTTAMLPSMQARAFEGQFAFARTPHLLDLPAAGIGKDQGPEVVRAGDRLIGEQIPGQEVVIAATDDQPKTLVG